jgi:NAD(P)H-hydrate epimerase
MRRVFPTVNAETLPWVSADKMREIDRIMVEELHIELLQMMENAGRNLADLILTRSAPDTVTVYAGPGGNGGGGLVAARHLANAGVDVSVVVSAKEERMSPVAAHQLDIVRRLGLSITSSAVPADIALDALVGYGLKGPLSGAEGELARAFGAMGNAIVSLDVPSGLNTSLGTKNETGVHAEATLALCLPKSAFFGDEHVGELYLAGISVPPSLVEQVTGLPAPPFRLGSILRIVMSSTGELN